MPRVSIGKKGRDAGGVGRGLRGDHARDLALAERLGPARQAPSEAVGHERGRGGAAGRDAHPAADQAAAQVGQPVARHAGPGGQDHAQGEPRALALERQPLLHGQQDLADAEQADHRHQEVEALEQLHRAEGEPELAGDRIQAHRRQREAQHHRAQDLGRRLLAHADEAAEGQELHGEELGRAEPQGEPGEVGGEEGDHQEGEQGADEGGEGADQCLAGPALLRHGIAVEGGGDRPGLARDVEQDGGDRPAEKSAPVNAGEHDDGRGRRHAEGQRQQDGHAVGAPQARQHADQDDQEQPDQHVQDVHGIGQDPEAQDQ
jgi:hypothetical protein